MEINLQEDTWLAARDAVRQRYPDAIAQKCENPLLAGTPWCIRVRPNEAPAITGAFEDEEAAWIEASQVIAEWPLNPGVASAQVEATLRQSPSLWGRIKDLCGS